jgi:hypothetical protein
MSLLWFIVFSISHRICNAILSVFPFSVFFLYSIYFPVLSLPPRSFTFFFSVCVYVYPIRSSNHPYILPYTHPSIFSNYSCFLFGLCSLSLCTSFIFIVFSYSCNLWCSATNLLRASTYVCTLFSFIVVNSLKMLCFFVFGLDSGSVTRSCLSVYTFNATSHNFFFATTPSVAGS